MPLHVIIEGGMLAQLWNKFGKPDHFPAYLPLKHLDPIIHSMVVYVIPIYFTPSSSSAGGGSSLTSTPFDLT